jgi:hypothetical protein
VNSSEYAKLTTHLAAKRSFANIKIQLLYFCPLALNSKPLIEYKYLSKTDIALLIASDAVRSLHLLQLS